MFLLGKKLLDFGSQLMTREDAGNVVPALQMELRKERKNMLQRSTRSRVPVRCRYCTTEPMIFILP